MKPLADLSSRHSIADVEAAGKRGAGVAPANTRRFKAPAARLVPVEEPPGLLHSVKKERDLVSPIGEEWDAAS